MTVFSLIERMMRFFARVLRGLLFRVESRLQGPRPPVGESLPQIPGWVREELLALSHIEPSLLPADDDMSRYAFYSVPSDPLPGRTYAALLEEIGPGWFSHVLLVPWLKQGGADRGIIYHARAIAESSASARVLVIGTEPADSPWASRLPQEVRFVSFGLIASELSLEKQALVLARMLVQMRPACIHVVNSRVGWEVVKSYALAFRQHSALYASLFCDDYSRRMVPVGYARTYLRDCFASFETVFCDNSYYPRVWSKELGVPAEAFTVLPFPYDGQISIVAASAQESGSVPSRVLWAGRLDRQKRPDILARVAECMPDVQFDVFGVSVMQGDAAVDISCLDRLPNVVRHGEFKRLADVVTDDHFAYLHTTAWEGTPTVLFDVAACGLPICAPAVGGILDFLDPDELVADLEDVPALVAKLRTLQSTPGERRRVMDLQLASLRRNRSWEYFVESLGKDARYLNVPPVPASAVA